MINFNCPHCRNPMRTRPGTEGRKGTCKSCGNTVIVPRVESIDIESPRTNEIAWKSSTVLVGASVVLSIIYIAVMTWPTEDNLDVGTEIVTTDTISRLPIDRKTLAVETEYLMRQHNSYGLRMTFSTRQEFGENTFVGSSAKSDLALTIVGSPDVDKAFILAAYTPDPSGQSANDAARHMAILIKTLAPSIDDPNDWIYRASRKIALDPEATVVEISDGRKITMSLPVNMILLFIEPINNAESSPRN